MNTLLREGPKAPKDPVKKRPFFFIMQEKEIFAAPQPDGKGIQFLFMDMGRLVDAAKLSGNIGDDYMLELLRSTEGFKTMVHSIGVSVSGRNTSETVKFVMEMYPLKAGQKATKIEKDVLMNGMEEVIRLDEINWETTDKEVGQIRFEFAQPGVQATTDIRLYLNKGFIAPVQPIERTVDFHSPAYHQMMQKSLFDMGNTSRLEKVLGKAGSGEDVTLAFIGGSITQGAGAIPINTKCYARVFADSFQEKYAKGGKVNLLKAGVGGTPSELGMLRFERDILRNGSQKPDLIVIEFAVNDGDDETQGVCYESLVRKALALPWKPAVVLLFAVFSFDWNLQDRLSPVGYKYSLPMVSIMDAVTPQFPLLPEDGRVISKNQFFYDVYHPSNLGHQIMADCLIELIDKVNETHCDNEPEPVEFPEPAIGADFERVELLDKAEFDKRKDKYKITSFCCGSFNDTDKDLQFVEMDSEIEQTPEFQYNWHHSGKEGAEKTFTITLSCSKLVMIFKDSGNSSYDKADVYVDGNLVKTLDPLVVGWTHCNPVILFNDKRTKRHKVEIKMQDASKKFTILGFGVVG